MSVKTQVFFLGITGYIGGAVFTRIRKSFPDFEYTALVRSEDAFDKVRTAGVENIVHGSHSDHAKISSEAAKADIVINCADADDLGLTHAVLQGMRMREGTPRPILLHTSGTSVVSDLSAQGNLVPGDDKVWNDNSEDDIRGVAPSQPHRNVDNEVFKACEAGEVNAYIIAPSCIYGTGDGPVRRLSQQIPNVIRTSLKLGKGVVVGPGTNIWNNVHVADLVELYDLVLKLALKGTDTSSPYARFYFGSVGRHCWGDIDQRIADILCKKKRLQSSEVEHVPLQELSKQNPQLRAVATNSHTRADRGFALGWSPKAPSLEDTLESDVDAVLAEM